MTLNFLVTQVAARLRVPYTGGIAINTDWTEGRDIKMRPETWEKIEALAKVLSYRGLARVKPHQLAALLLELAVEQVDES